MNYVSTCYLTFYLVFTSIGMGCMTPDKSVNESEHLTFVTHHRAELDKKFRDTNTSPLDSIAFISFERLNYFPVNYDYLVVGTFKKNISDTFRMKTSTERLPLYRKYGEIEFEMYGNKYGLTAYQNIEFANSDTYENELFIPFKDYTNGISSYGGGRYIDIQIPHGETVEIDFNLSYNPYCAYNDRYSCPIPPEENHLEVEIKAGVKKFREDH